MELLDAKELGSISKTIYPLIAGIWGSERPQCAIGERIDKASHEVANAFGYGTASSVTSIHSAFGE